jgi:uncharacterized RDD family membrane protein YckC
VLNNLVENFKRYKITEIRQIRYYATGEPYYSFRQVNVVRGWARFAHYLIDVLALQGIAALINYAFAFTAENPVIMSEDELYMLQVKLTALGLLYNFVYYAAFETFYGSTPGKMLLGRVVINEYGERPDFPRIALRTVCRWIPFDAISCFWPRGWHDQLSKTFVVTKAEADELWDAIIKMEKEDTQLTADTFRAQQGPTI